MAKATWKGALFAESNATEEIADYVAFWKGVTVEA